MGKRGGGREGKGFAKWSAECSSSAEGSSASTSPSRATAPPRPQGPPTSDERTAGGSTLEKTSSKLSSLGYIAVYDEDKHFRFSLQGLVPLYDPPRCRVEHRGQSIPITFRLDSDSFVKKGSVRFVRKYAVWM